MVKVIGLHAFEMYYDDVIGMIFVLNASQGPR